MEITSEMWHTLISRATEAMRFAYVPYSKYPVGVAALVDDGRIVTGCNVENASYGLTLCAECGMVSELARTGGGRLIAFACVDGEGKSLTPCGRCRQLLFEHGGKNLQVWDDGRVITMDDLLPGAFGPDHLTAAESGR
jgi:cytidine deaminase